METRNNPSEQNSSSTRQEPVRERIVERSGSGASGGLVIVTLLATLLIGFLIYQIYVTSNRPRNIDINLPDVNVPEKIELPRVEVAPPAQ